MTLKYDWSEKNILVADDDDINFELIRLIFRQTKANIIHLKDGQQVVDFLSKNDAVDLVLMDIQMPVLDGMQATKLLRANNYKGNIFALTALCTSDQTKLFKEAEFNEVVEKPIRREPFLELVNTYLNN